jgi:hypothetical protein
MRLAQRLLPPLAAADVLDVEEHVLVFSAIASETLLKANGRDVILARMTDEET